MTVQFGGRTSDSLQGDPMHEAKTEVCRYSVVVPAYCEEQSLAELADRVAAVFEGLGHGGDFEIIFVDDGSTDDTRQVIRTLAAERPYVRYCGFRRNQGKSLALMAGFYATRGALVFTMDADLQDRPEDMPKLISAMGKGVDVVSGWREHRNDGLLRALYSKLFNTTVSCLTGLTLHDFNCGFKLYRRVVLERIQVYGQLHRFVPFLAHMQGFKVIEAVVGNAERKYGGSRFPAMRVGGIFDLLSLLFLSRYSFSPLHFFAKVGLLLGVPSACIFAYLLGEHVLSWFGSVHPLVARPLLLVSLVGMLLGANIFLSGFVCDFMLHHRIRDNLRATIEALVDESR